MPELPEVETIKRGLKSFILQKKIKKIDVLCEKSFIGQPVTGEVRNIRRFGKALVIDLDSGYSLLTHLRMTGQLIYDPNISASDINNRIDNGHDDAPASRRYAAGHPSDNFVSKLPNRQTRVVITLDGGTLYFNDQRKFGFIKVLKTPDVEKDSFIAKLASEPWQMSPDDLHAKLQKRSSSAIKTVILDQTVICGLGNIYADEALYTASIHPARKSGSLSQEETAQLLIAARKVMEDSIDAGGSTLQNYVKADGTRGDYLDLFAKVYHRDGQPCTRCGAIIEKTKISGRGTHFCPHCQKLGSTSRKPVENSVQNLVENPVENCSAIQHAGVSRP